MALGALLMWIFFNLVSAMSQRILSFLLAATLLGGCGGNPFANVDLGDDGEEEEEDGGSIDGGGGGTGGGGTTAPLIPVTVTRDAVVASTQTALQAWSAGDGTLEITMNAQDLSGPYVRDAALDVGPYQAYTYQGTTSNRKVVALVREVGQSTAVIAVDAGQFANSHFGGAVYRTDVFSLPTEAEFLADRQAGRYDYSGTYVGLLNVGNNTAGGPGGTLNPAQSWRTTGRALVTADFQEMRVSGGVDQRVVVDAGGAALNPLADIALWSTSIAANGTFTETVRRLDPTGWASAGTYGGAFSGDDASEVAVVMVFNPVRGEAELFEQGMIVLSNCVTAGGPACP
jgi:hypothetical protein